MKKILSQKQVLEIIPYSSSSLWRKEKAGEFPARIQLGPNRCGWREEEILAWLDARPLGPIQAIQTRDEGQKEYVAALKESGLTRKEFNARRKAEHLEKADIEADAA